MDKVNKINNENEEVEINLADLFMELLHNWVKIVLSAVIVGVIVFVYFSNLVTPMYTSTSILYVLSKSTSITSLTDIQVGSNLATDYVEVISSRPVLDQVIENLGLDMGYAELLDMVSLENPEDTRLLEITVTSEDPELAKEIADEIADVSAAFIADKMDQDAPSIIQYGYVSTSPSTPRVMKNTVLGAVVGAVIAVIIICIVYLMNDTIITPEDMESRVGIRVLASLPDEGEEEYDGSPSKKGKHKKKKK